MSNDFSNIKSGTVQRNIDGTVYTLGLLPILPQAVALSKLVSICVPVLTAIKDKEINDVNAAAFLEAYGQESVRDEINFTYIAGVLATQIESLGVENFIENLLRNVWRDNKKLNIKEDNDPNTMELIAWALKENFAESFLKMAKDKGLEIDFLKEFLPKGMIAE